MKIRFTHFGMHGYSKKYYADISKLIIMLPYLITFELIPPLRVLNSVFKEGIDDGGMSGGCEWKPFQIDQKIHNKIVRTLCSSNKQLRFIDPPKYIKTKMEWGIWKGSYITGYPLKRSLAIHKKIDYWSLRQRKCESKGDPLGAVKAMGHIMKWSDKDMKLIKPYIDKYHAKKREMK